ncbi:MAG: TetR/AcrR family transcriptional regulator [Acidimicrobiales bacterium]
MATDDVSSGEPHATGTPGGAADEAGGRTRQSSTRDRILDIALRLFTEKGFDATSLQEVADELGFTKAALYYHFKSKEDILMALHTRMHQFGREGLERLSEGPVTLEVWESILTSLIHEMVTQRPLFLLHERNQTVMERLHRQDHEAQHEDLQARLRRILSDPSVSLRDRIRMSCSIGAIFSVVFMGGDALDLGSEAVEPLLRDAVHDLLFPPH